jgi:hypothetical protein
VAFVHICPARENRVRGVRNWTADPTAAPKPSPGNIGGRAHRRRREGPAPFFCLDRYLEIDPPAEISIETGLPVHNVVHVRSQLGAAGTILNNLVALGVGGFIPSGSVARREGFICAVHLAAGQGEELDYSKPISANVYPLQAAGRHPDRLLSN